MKVLISGSSNGIGLAAAKKYLELGHEVYGLDLQKSNISAPNYFHFVCDIRKKESLPTIEDVDILVNNAGLQNSENDIENNLVGTINVTEKYGLSNKNIKSILFNASASSISGQEFPLYVASKAGVVGYMRNVAIKLAPQKVTVNAISFGGVLTESNKQVINNTIKWNEIMDVTPLKKWMALEETTEWIIFLTLTNKSMSGQNILVDNGEKDLNPTFVW